MRILLVEDDTQLLKALRIFFTGELFVVDCVEDGEAAMRRMELYRDDYDTIVLDWKIPKVSGVDVCRTIRDRGITTPIIMLTAKSETDDKIEALRCGADDYLTKPFSPPELLARVRAVLRRPRISLPSMLSVGDLTLDPNSRQVRRGRLEIRLTTKEFMLLEFFMRNADRVLNREEIFAHAWDFTSNAMSNVVDVHIHSLRKKISDDGKLLETVPGVGYRLNGTRAIATEVVV